jgi:hypothetical protein
MRHAAWDHPSCWVTWHRELLQPKVERIISLSPDCRSMALGTVSDTSPGNLKLSQVVHGLWLHFWLGRRWYVGRIWRDLWLRLRRCQRTAMDWEAMITHLDGDTISIKALRAIPMRTPCLLPCNAIANIRAVAFSSTTPSFLFPFPFPFFALLAVERIAGIGLASDCDNLIRLE